MHFKDRTRKKQNMISPKKIEIIIKRMAVISVIYGFFHVKIFDEIAIYTMVLCIQFLISLMILNHIKPYGSIMRDPLILLALLTISGIASWAIYLDHIYFKAPYLDPIYAKAPTNAKELSHWVMFLSSLTILFFSFYNLSKSYLMKFKSSDKTRRIEIVLLGICFVLNLVGISLNAINVFLSILIFGLGLTILLSPILLLNFIFLNINIVFKWFFISYLVLTNSITLFIILLDTNSVSNNTSLFGKLFGEYDFIWPLINIVTGVIWAILLLFNQNMDSKYKIIEGKESKQ